MSSEDIAIRVSNLGKCYEIYNNPRDRLKQFVLPTLQWIIRQPPKQYFRDFWALQDVSFEIRKGETLGIIGRNGSGKSTLLQLICGTLNATTGSIQTNGRIAALLELGSGFNPEFTGRENIYMNASILGLSNAEIDARYDDIVFFADIGDFIDQPVKIYSSGMLVRLAFAVATQVDPDILIVDEALSVGDIRFQVKCYRKFEEFREKGKTIIFVSHSTNDVIRLCARVIWLDNGMIRKSGISKDIVEEYLAWMVHDTGIQQAAIDSDINTTTANQEYDLIPVSSNALITGEGGASIDAVGFFTEDNKRITLLDGPQKVKIVYRVSTKVRIEIPYIGFSIIDRTGLYLLGCNNHVLGKQCSPIEAGKSVNVCITFNFPEIKNGIYLIAAGINEGTMETPIRLQNVMDAYEFQFQSHSQFQKQVHIFKLNDCEMDIKEP